MPAKIGDWQVAGYSRGQIDRSHGDKKSCQSETWGLPGPWRKGAMNEELPPFETLWRILQARRRAAIRKEIANRSGLSAPASRSCPAPLVDEEHLSVSGAGELIASEEIYRTTKRSLQTTNLLPPIRGGCR